MQNKEQLKSIIKEMLEMNYTEKEIKQVLNLMKCCEKENETKGELCYE